MMRARDAARAVFAAALLLTVGASAHADTAAKVVASNGLKVTIPYNALGVGVTPLWIAIDDGYFRRYGIEVTPGGALQSPAIIASMLSGETPFAIAGEDAVISADLNGGDIEIVAAGTQKLHFTIYAVPSVHTTVDLKGKKLGVTQFGTTTDFIARYVLKQAGLRPGDDVTILPMGSQATMFAALRDQKIDAGVLGSEVALQAGLLGSLNPLMSMLDSDLLFYSDSLLAKRSWVEAHRNDTLNIVRAYASGVAAIFTDKSAALAAIGKYTKTADSAAVEGGYQLLVKALPKIPLPKPVALQTGLDESKLPGAKSADPKSFIDPSFVAQLQQEGFIDGLYHGHE